MHDGKLYKQVDEKHLYTEVDLMLWSPKMDLVAVTTMAGEVILHRLSWQKVWLLTQLKENVLVSSLVWRPDGKVLAIGYSNGVLQLCNVEKAQRMYEHARSMHAITSLSWCNDSHYSHESTPAELSYYLRPDMNEMFKDNSRTYLSDLSSLTPKSSGNNKTQDISLLKDQEGLNILLVGNSAGELELFAFGFVPIAKIILPGSQPQKILNTVLSANMNNLTIISEGNDSNLNLIIYTCPQLNSNKEEIKFLALKLGKLMELENYLSEVLKQMSEVYEDILFEFESKMRKYTEEKKEHNDRSLRNEFLFLLTYGKVSEDLKCFVQFELTKQSLTRLGTSVRNSYSHIKNLIIQNLSPVCIHIIFHLEKMEGMSRVQNQFGKLGLSEKRVEENILHATNLGIKSHEMLQVIQDTVRNFEAFYKWLYPAKLFISGESVPQGMAELKDQDFNNIIAFITEYFQPNARMERVGQYLKDQDLANPIDDPKNIWNCFLEQASSAFKENTKEFLPEIHTKYSLVQVARSFQDSLKDMINDCSSCLQNSFKFYSSLNFVNNLHDSKIMPLELKSQKFFVSSSTNILGTTSFVVIPRVVPTCRCFYYFKVKPAQNRVTVESVAIMNTDSNDLFEVIDAEFYDDKTLCLLVHNENDCQLRGSSKIIHLNLTELDGAPAAGESSIVTNVGKVFIKDLSRLPQRIVSTDCNKDDVICVAERFHASQFAVSGKRKVACVLYSSRKRIRLFLTEWEDDGDASAVMMIDETARTLDDSFDVDSTLRVSDITIDSPDDNDKENSAV